MAGAAVSGAIVAWLLIALVGINVLIFLFGWRKNPDRNLFVSSTILTLTCCYLMWAITYLAQLQPIVHPEIKHHE